MSIEEKIRERLHIAIKINDVFEKSILRTILGEFARKGKNINDTLATEVLVEIRKNLYEVNTVDSLKEAELVSEYLPRIMSEEEIEFELSAIILSNEGIKFKVLKDTFDKEFPGQNGAIVAKIIKELL